MISATEMVALGLFLTLSSLIPKKKSASTAHLLRGNATNRLASSLMALFNMIVKMI